ncbi:uncharacterized protein HKW66_Vig0239070 [Vigna angularis]|uniref:Uncharacterized protein n=1 Tax=Phaseolus angularis TaxID=3914 RepID=A0A8T0KR82_PHAAN|nr:uncharacterized protein HKW66_Vig0239070 [Vigna angularis]
MIEGLDAFESPFITSYENRERDEEKGQQREALLVQYISEGQNLKTGSLTVCSSNNPDVGSSIADVEFEDIGAHNEPKEEREHGDDDEHDGEDLVDEADDAVEDAATTAAQAPASTSAAGLTAVGLRRRNGGTVVSAV